MTPFEPGEPDFAERRTRPATVAADRERDLVLDAIRDQVAPRVLRQVARASTALHGSVLCREQSRRDLRQGRLADPVRAGERDDLPTAKRERDAVQHRLVAVAVGDVLQAAQLLAVDLAVARASRPRPGR